MIDFHSIKAKQALEELESSENGLSHIEAAKRIKKHGLNELPKAKPISKAAIFFSQFNSALVYVLLLAGVLSIVLGAIIDAGVIFGAVIINVIIGFFQENKANKSILGLKSLVEHRAFVLRGDQEVYIKSNLVVLGDIIILKAGNRVPADARLIETLDLRLNEASLTGESFPSKKKTDVVPKGAAIADRENMVYAGTVVVSGIGKAVVTAVGQKTEIGHIAELITEEKEENTPLQKRLSVFSRQLGMLFAVICVIIVIAGLYQGRGMLEMLETGVAVGVASIPEGLTVAVTFILALGMQQILKQKALTRKLVAAETLGSTTVICSDKTGTLTEGKMHVDHIIIGEKEFELGSAGSRQNKEEALAVSLALQISMMCNDASVENPQDALAEWKIIGSPTETALLSAAIQSGLKKEELLKHEPKIDEIPFDSEKKYMISLHKRSDSSYVIYEKGAPERILEKSSKYYHLGKKDIKLTSSHKNRLIKTYESLTSKGLRVIALAIKEIKSNEAGIMETGEADWKVLDKELTFVGFIAIRDPLRAEAKDTILACREAGIRPVLITGDHQLTAKAIAEEVGLKDGPSNIKTGEELEQISDEKLRKLVKDIDVYARVSPHHKLRIVKALQDIGEVVAMTGDGINDSPALKAADIGISLGTATDIAKETSDIVLLDNNFKTIVAAIKQGRVIFKNIRKVITFLMSDSFSEIILILGSILFHTPLAILPAQILWINIVNDSFPHFSLAFEKGDSAIMKRKPIKKNEPILTREMKLIIFGVGIVRDLLIFGIFFFLWREWASSEYLMRNLTTIMFVTLGVKSLMAIFSLRALRRPIWTINPFSNKYLNSAVLVSLLFLILGVYWPPLQVILHTTSISLNYWAIPIGIGIFGVLLTEFVKWVFAVNVKRV